MMRWVILRYMRFLLDILGASDWPSCLLPLNHYERLRSEALMSLFELVPFFLLCFEHLL